MVDAAEPVTIRLATAADVPAIKSIADREKGSLGFVHRGALCRAVECEGLVVAEIADQVVAFCHLYRRRDGVATIYHIAVARHQRGRGIGRALIEKVAQHVAERGVSLLRLKCLQDLDANAFYAWVGFAHSAVISRESRPLIVWERDVPECQPQQQSPIEQPDCESP